MSPRRRAWAVWMLVGVPVVALAAESERSRITAERKAMAGQFAAEERACVDRFAVTACVDDVRARRREALAPLRERELKLDEADRQQRAQERRKAIAQRQAEAKATQERIDKRQAERAAQGTKPRPLPVPTASPASSAGR